MTARPLTTLDGEISAAFCPAPRNPTCGQTVHLEPAAGEKPSREVVHPFLRLSVDTLFRVGVVKKEVPKDLWPARRSHLLRLRELFGRPDYAADTDSELDGGGAP